jgi:hypothetical protein
MTPAPCPSRPPARGRKQAEGLHRGPVRAGLAERVLSDGQPAAGRIGRRGVGNFASAGRSEVGREVDESLGGVVVGRHAGGDQGGPEGRARHGSCQASRRSTACSRSRTPRLWSRSRAVPIGSAPAARTSLATVATRTAARAGPSGFGWWRGCRGHGPGRLAIPEPGQGPNRQWMQDPAGEAGLDEQRGKPTGEVGSADSTSSTADHSRGGDSAAWAIAGAGGAASLPATGGSRRRRRKRTAVAVPRADRGRDRRRRGERRAAGRAKRSTPAARPRRPADRAEATSATDPGAAASSAPRNRAPQTVPRAAGPLAIRRVGSGSPLGPRVAMSRS